MNLQELAQWITTGLTLATFVGLLIVFIKIGHWTGVTETKLHYVERKATHAHSRIDSLMEGRG